MASDIARSKAAYFARLAEQAECYEEIADHVDELRQLCPCEATDEEQRLAAVAQSYTVGSRKAAWRSISDAAREACIHGDQQRARLAFQYREEIEDQISRKCTGTREHITVQQDMANSAPAFYQKMKVEVSCNPVQSGRQTCTEIVPGLERQRIRDLLLEFPEATNSGIRWTTLTKTYSERYGEALDPDVFGHERLSPAARAMLDGVIRPVSTMQEAEQATSNEDLLVAIDDRLALSSQPGCAGSWPAMYKSLCALVRQCGVEETEVSDEEGVPERILLMSKLRPLLDSEKEGCARKDSAVLQARNLLLSQLKPVSKLSRECSAETGLSFRDEEGSLRRLQKLGHVVKAVLQWRDQHLQWRQLLGAKSTGLDSVLSPKLELIFSKRLNNLVLRLRDHKSSVGVVASAPRQEPEDSSHGNRCPRKLVGRHPHDFCENPFKWQPLTRVSDARIATAASPFGRRQLTRCADGDHSSKKSNPSPRSEHEDRERNHVHNELLSVKPQTDDRPVESDVVGHSGRRSSPMSAVGANTLPRRSHSRGPRSSSSLVRARSSERDAVPFEARSSVHRDDSELRSTSEPPRQRWADIVDDPEEVPPANLFTQLPTYSKEQLWRQFGESTNEGAHDFNGEPHTIESANAAVCEKAADKEIERPTRWSSRRWTSPPRIDNMPVNRTRTPSIAPQLSDGAVRTISLTRARSRPTRQQISCSSARQESLEPRCNSEPPSSRWLDVFDDPFEPPPQDLHWPPLTALAAPGRLSTNAVAVEQGQTSNRELLAVSSAQSASRSLPQEEKVATGKHWTCRRWASPNRSDISSVAIGNIQNSSARPRARSLTRSPEGSMHRDASDSGALHACAEPRCTSEPPQQRFADVYDDPFEPPPQEAWRLPLPVPLHAGSFFPA